jgi:hypothetical protein
MTAQTIDPTSPARDAAKKLAIVKHLAGGKSLDVTATIVGLDRPVVLDVASKHGYPDTDKLAWAADVLEKRLADEQAAATVKTGPLEQGPRVNQPHPVAAQRTPARPSPSPTSTSTPGQAAAGGSPGGQIEALLDRAEEHPAKRIQNAAAKVRADVDRLRELIREDEEKNAEKRKAAAERAAAKRKAAEEKAKAKEEVERLKAELAEAQAKLRGGKAKPAAAKPARERGSLDYACRNDGCDKAYDTPQGRSMHERLRCEHREQAAS